MRLRRSMILIAVGCLSCGVASIALAQPAPPPPRRPGVVVPPPPPPRAPPPALPRAPEPPTPQGHFDHRDDRHEDGREVAREKEQRDKLLERERQERERRKAERKNEKAWREAREQRARDRRKELQTTWGQDVVNRPEARQELATHADRMARLDRLLDIAEDRGDAAMTAQVQSLIQREVARDALVMQQIRSGQ